MVLVNCDSCIDRINKLLLAKSDDGGDPCARRGPIEQLGASASGQRAESLSESNSSRESQSEYSREFMGDNSLVDCRWSPPMLPTPHDDSSVALYGQWTGCTNPN